MGTNSITQSVCDTVTYVTERNRDIRSVAIYTGETRFHPKIVDEIAKCLSLSIPTIIGTADQAINTSVAFGSSMVILIADSLDKVSEIIILKTKISC